LSKLTSVTAQLDWVKDQFKIRTNGFGWVEFKMPFSKKGDASIGTVDNLTAELKRVIEDEKGRVPPEEPPVEAARCRRLPVLGTMTEQRKAFDGECLSREDMRSSYKAACAAKAVGAGARARKKRDPHALKQPELSPEVDGALVGKHIEVLTEIEEPQVDKEGKEVVDDEGNEVMVYSKQWLPAEVAKISKGGDKKKNKTGTMIKVQVGWVLLDYDDGVSLWTRLRQGQFNCTALGSWRLDLDATADEGAGEEAAGEEVAAEEEEMEDEGGPVGGGMGSSEDEESGSEGCAGDEDETEGDDSDFGSADEDGGR
jgi:hypothetical protein